MIDERTYLNGRFVTGTYFLERRVAGLTGVDFDRRALIGLRFTGLVKVREFVDGYEWARFQWRPDRRSWLDRPLTAFLQLVLGARYDAYQRRYRDVHERNVLFEVRTLSRQAFLDWPGTPPDGFVWSGSDCNRSTCAEQSSNPLKAQRIYPPSRRRGC